MIQFYFAVISAILDVVVILCYSLFVRDIYSRIPEVSPGIYGASPSLWNLRAVSLIPLFFIFSAALSVLSFFAFDPLS